MRSLNTQTRDGGVILKIVFARLAPSRNAKRNKSQRCKQRDASAVAIRTNRTKNAFYPAQCVSDETNRMPAVDGVSDRQVGGYSDGKGERMRPQQVDQLARHLSPQPSAIAVITSSLTSP